MHSENLPAHGQLCGTQQVLARVACPRANPRGIRGAQRRGVGRAARRRVRRAPPLPSPLVPSGGVSKVCTAACAALPSTSNARDRR